MARFQAPSGEDEFLGEPDDMDARVATLLARPKWTEWVQHGDEASDDSGDSDFEPSSSGGSDSDESGSDSDGEDGAPAAGPAGAAAATAAAPGRLWALVASAGGLALAPLLLAVSTCGFRRFPLGQASVWAFLATAALNVGTFALGAALAAAAWAPPAGAEPEAALLGAAGAVLMWGFQWRRLHALVLAGAALAAAVAQAELSRPAVVVSAEPSRVAAGGAAELAVTVGSREFLGWHAAADGLLQRAGLGGVPRPVYPDGHVGFAAPGCGVSDECSVRHAGRLADGSLSVRLPKGTYVACYRPATGQPFACAGGALVSSS